jgi:hypothetical protein
VRDRPLAARDQPPGTPPPPAGELRQVHGEASGASLRAPRNRRGLTLGHRGPDGRGGRLRIAVMAAYERGEENASVQHLQ